MLYLIFTNFKVTFFFFNDPATTEIYTLSLHDALPICISRPRVRANSWRCSSIPMAGGATRSEEHTSELQSPDHLVCRLLLEKKKFHTSNPSVEKTANAILYLLNLKATPDILAEIARAKSGQSFFFNDTATTEIYTLSLHDALPISNCPAHQCDVLRRSRRSGEAGAF